MHRSHTRVKQMIHLFPPSNQQSVYSRNYDINFALSFPTSKWHSTIQLYQSSAPSSPNVHNNKMGNAKWAVRMKQLLGIQPGPAPLLPVSYLKNMFMSSNIEFNHFLPSSTHMMRMISIYPGYPPNIHYNDINSTCEFS